MALNQKPPPPEEEIGAPQWMLTFSDCLTLLLTFFVLLMTFSSISEETIPGLSRAFRKVMPGFKWADQMYRNNLATITRTEAVDAVYEGSEHATLEQGTSGLLKESLDSDPFEARVFLIPSSKVFIGKATALLPQGRRILDTLTAYLKRINNGVVISEYGVTGSAASDQIGLMRASTVVDYLITQGGLERNRFGISSAGVTDTQDIPGAGQTGGNVLEIALLGQGISE